MASSSSELGALPPYAGPTSSADLNAAEVERGLRPGQERPRRRTRQLGDPDLENVELRFLRVVGRNKVNIALSEDLTLDSPDDRRGINHGATMEVYPGTWRGRRVAVKYLRKTLPTVQSPEFAYRRAMVDLLFELQIMSRPSLTRHPNITQLLAVCFQGPSGEEGDLESLPSKPGLVVELAHEEYPDLQHFFNHAYNPGRAARLPFETAKTFISGIASGVAALHSHDLVHADLKPGNILIFPSQSSPCGLVTKIADFGFAGMVVFTDAGKRAPVPDGRPRGGTSEWNAPECLDDPDPWTTDRLNAKVQSLEHPQYLATRDIYSFGLLTCYIALDGLSPKQMVLDLQATKQSGKLSDVAIQQLEAHFLDGSEDLEPSILKPTMQIARLTLCREPIRRLQSLRAIEDVLNGR
jgi:serine/threonine protein kinase